jgi:putative peptidoglycan lipid II flippase
MEPISSSSTAERKRLARNSYKAIAGTMLSRTSGVIRTLVINASFGANIALDAFNSAFRFPNGLRDLLADGALSAAFVKVMVDRNAEGIDATRKFISIVTGFFLVITLLLAFAGFVFAKPFMQLISGKQFAVRDSLSIATILFQILVFYLPITMLNAIAMGILAVKDASFRAMNGSIFLSAGMIAGVFFLGPLFSYLGQAAIIGVAVGALLGAILQLIYQAYPLKKWGLLVPPNLNITQWLHFKPLSEVLRLMGPRALGQGALVVALIVNTFYAIKIGIGAITYVTTTVMIIQVPIGLFGVATGFATLPLISNAVREKKFTLFNELLTDSLKSASWLSLFTLLGFALLIVPIYNLIFQHGRIHFADTIQNCIAICAYGIGIFFAANSKILLNALYALNATRQIIINAFVYLGVNVLLTVWLTPYFGLIGLGISFATACAADCWLNFYVVQRKLQKNITGYQFKNLTARLAGLSILAYLIGILGVLLTLYFWQDFKSYFAMPLTYLISSLILAIGGFILLIIFYFLTLQFGPSEIKNVLEKIKFRK